MSSLRRSDFGDKSRGGQGRNDAKVTFTLSDTQKTMAEEIYDFLIARSEEDERGRDDGSDETAGTTRPGPARACRAAKTVLPDARELASRDDGPTTAAHAVYVCWFVVKGEVMKTAIIFRWKRPNPGREAEGWAFGKEVDKIFSAWEKEGRCGPHMWVASMGNEEDPMFILWGEPMQLVELSASPEFAALFATGYQLNEDNRYTFSIAGETVEETWPSYEQALADSG